MKLYLARRTIKMYNKTNEKRKKFPYNKQGNNILQRKTFLIKSNILADKKKKWNIHTLYYLFFFFFFI